MVLVAFASVPEKPVKFKLRTEPALNVSPYVPVVKLKLIELASVGEPGLTVVPVAVLFDTFTADVPVTVKFVAVPVFHTVPVPFTTMFPVPKARVRAVVPLLVNDCAVNVYV